MGSKGKEVTVEGDAGVSVRTSEALVSRPDGLGFRV